MVTTQAANTNASTLSGQVVSVSGVKTASGVSGLSNATASASKPEIIKIGGKSTMISHPTIIQSQSQPSGVVTSAQLQPITAQQLVNAKVLGVQGFQGISQANQRVKAGNIRMVNASNLNIANIDGKQNRSTFPFDICYCYCTIGSLYCYSFLLHNFHLRQAGNNCKSTNTNDSIAWPNFKAIIMDAARQQRRKGKYNTGWKPTSYVCQPNR